MKFLFSIVLACSSIVLFGQDNAQKWINQYADEKLTASGLVKLIDVLDFKPKILKADRKSLKFAILQMTPEEVNQLTKDAYYLCCNKHEDYMQIWNMYYVKQTKETWDSSCMLFMALMLIDGTARTK